jgi:phosphopantothenoylcysteine decarboxylase/phosphopantothenate--cysteine ligase
MGYALAKAAADRGAEVTLISGRTALASPVGVHVIAVESVMQMYNVVMEEYAQMDVIIKADAVSDFRPIKRAQNKTKNLRSKPTKNPPHKAKL